MLKKILNGMIMSITLTNTAFAFFCPTNFTQINMGDSIDQINQQCGKPALIETKKVEPTGPQEWNYYIPQTVASDTLTPMQGSLKMQVTMDNKGKVININVNGIGVGATSVCGNNIQLGDTKEAIKKVCGNPGYINKESTADLEKTHKADIMTTYIYKSDPPVKLIFTNGKLTSKQ